MSLTLCLDDLSKQEEIIADKMKTSTSWIRDFSKIVFVYKECRSMFKYNKDYFYGRKYEELAKHTSQKEMQALIPTLRGFIIRQNKIINILNQKNRLFFRLLIRATIKNIQKTNSIHEEKILDFTLATNTKFLGAMEKIFDGANNNHVDISKVKRFESFI